MAQPVGFHHHGLPGRQLQAFAAAQEMVAGARASALFSDVESQPDAAARDAQQAGLARVQGQRVARLQLAIARQGRSRRLAGSVTSISFGRSVVA